MKRSAIARRTMATTERRTLRVNTAATRTLYRNDETPVARGLVR
jgi:hypothetical protein